MKKFIKVLWIIDISLFFLCFLVSAILELLRAFPFPKGEVFDIVWNIFVPSTYILSIPIVIYLICIIKNKNK